MITIQDKTYNHSGYSWCEQCKDTVCDGTNVSQKYKICVNGHKQHYGSSIKQNNDFKFFML